MGRNDGGLNNTASPTRQMGVARLLHARTAAGQVTRREQQVEGNKKKFIFF